MIPMTLPTQSSDWRNDVNRNTAIRNYNERILYLLESVRTHSTDQQHQFRPWPNPNVRFIDDLSVSCHSVPYKKQHDTDSGPRAGFQYGNYITVFMKSSTRAAGNR